MPCQLYFDSSDVVLFTARFLFCRVLPPPARDAPGGAPDPGADVLRRTTAPFESATMSATAAPPSRANGSPNPSISIFSAQCNDYYVEMTSGMMTMSAGEQKP